MGCIHTAIHSTCRSPFCWSTDGRPSFGGDYLQAASRCSQQVLAVLTSGWALKEPTYL